MRGFDITTYCIDTTTTTQDNGKEGERFEKKETAQGNSNGKHLEVCRVLSSCTIIYCVPLLLRKEVLIVDQEKKSIILFLSIRTTNKFRRDYSNSSR